MSLLGEINRRKIFQVAAVYAVVAWLLIQIVATVEAPLRLPDWFDTMVILLLAIGFPVTLIISWAFNLTPEGLVREGNGDARASGRGRKIEHVLFGVLALAVVFLFVDNYVLDEGDETVALTTTSSPIESAVENVDTQSVQDVLPNSIAVLPFENLSPDPDNAYFAAGIHESTLNRLGKISGLIVLSRTSVLQYEENRPSIPEIAKALNAAMIMEGSVRYANGRVLITAQLIEGRSDTHLWSAEFNKELTDVFAVQAEVARQIASKMKLQLLPEEQARIESRPTESAVAYAHFLHALSLPNPVVFPEFWPAHVDSLNKSIRADPAFADAYALLARIHYARPTNRQLAVDYARQAIELDPTVGLAYNVIAMRDRYYYDRQDEARANFERAIELSPNDPEVLIESARQLAEQSGEYVAGIEVSERAIVIDSSDIRSQINIGLLYMRAGNLEAAAEHQQRLIEMVPGAYNGYLDLATTQYLLGNQVAATENLDRAVTIMSSGATFRTDYIAYLYGLLGELEKVDSLLERHGAPMADPQSEAWETLGWAALGTRDKEQALRVWTTTIDGYINHNKPVSLGRITRFRDNWLSDPMLEEPEFIALRRRVGYEG